MSDEQPTLDTFTTAVDQLYADVDAFAADVASMLTAMLPLHQNMKRWIQSTTTGTS